MDWYANNARMGMPLRSLWDVPHTLRRLSYPLLVFLLGRCCNLTLKFNKFCLAELLFKHSTKLSLKNAVIFRALLERTPALHTTFHLSSKLQRNPLLRADPMQPITVCRNTTSFRFYMSICNSAIQRFNHLKQLCMKLVQLLSRERMHLIQTYAFTQSITKKSYSEHSSPKN
jgi:hypothetical protein